MQTARGTPLSRRRGTDDPADSTDSATLPPRRLLLFVAVVTVAYSLDVVTKIVAVEYLAGPPVKTINVIPHVLDLTLVRNSGAAFGIATGYTAVLTAIAAIVCLVVIRLAARLRDPVWALGLGLLLGGAMGNLTDRFVREPEPMHGHVIDFLQLPNWPVFNLADCCVCVAAGLIALQSFRGIGLDGRHIDHKDEKPGSGTDTSGEADQ